jgi:hypothetical protein
MKKIEVVLMLFIFTGLICPCQILGQNNSKKDSLQTKLKFVNALEQKKNQIIGCWIIKGESEPVFKITKDKIIYFNEEDASYKYVLTLDSIMINFRKMKLSKSPYVIEKDTLIFIHKNKKLNEIYYRAKSCN